MEISKKMIEWIMDEDRSSPGPWLLPFRIAFVCVLTFGMTVNYKLFNRVRKEITGERGKAFQVIVKCYTMIQFFGWPCIWIWFAVWQWTILQKFDGLFSPCVYLYAYHIGIFAYVYQRLYVAFHSLILAAGRYIFVVHDIRVLNWGIQTVSRVLIASSFLIPLLMALLVESSLEMSYNGWLAEIRVHESECALSDKHLHKFDEMNPHTPEFFRSPFYYFVHSRLPDWATNSLFWIGITMGAALFSNFTEGIIYTLCAIFVFR